MSGHDPEVVSQVDMLVQAGLVSAADRDRATAILHARRHLERIRFGPATNDLDAARDRLRHEIRAIHEGLAGVRETVRQLEPLNTDSRCREAMAVLGARVDELAAACGSLTDPGGVPGSTISRLHADVAEVIRALQHIVAS